MNRIRRLLIKIRLAKVKPHEKAELGKGTWGRQPETSGKMPTKTRPKASLKMRVYHKATDTWEEVK